MAKLRINQPALQIWRNGIWNYVFCKNERNDIVFAEKRENALSGEYLNIFQSKFANDTFRLELPERKNK